MKKYKYGDCITESIKIYNKLKSQGKNPQFVEGWVEVSEFPDLLPCREFLELYYPLDLKTLDNDLECDNYIRVFDHTWIICDGKIIDKTRNQFDIYGGILVYYEKMRYIPINKVTAFDITKWFDERDYIITKRKKKIIVNDYQKIGI